MQLWRKKKNSPKDDNRINIIMAIIFLLGGGVLFKLFSLQVLNYDIYVAKANGQHQVSGVLEQERGRIFIQDGNKINEENKLYPLASSKKFVSLYAVPKNIKNAPLIAEQLYAIFKEEQTIKEVGYLLEKEDKEILESKLDDLRNLPEEERMIAEQKIIRAEESLKAGKDYQIIRTARIEEEIKKIKESIIKKYLEALTKENDPFELLEQKVSEEKLKIFFAGVIASSTDDNTGLKNLEFKNDKLQAVDPAGDKKELKIDGLDFLVKAYRFYPENNIGSNMVGFVSYADEKARGQYGLEGFFNEELTGMTGSVKTERSAAGELIIVNDRQYAKPQNGNDLILTINRSIQFEACRKLNAAVLRHGADGGSVIVMEPKTGAIIAMCSAPDFDSNNYRDVKDMSVYNNNAIFSQYEPGSIFKALTMAMAIDQRKVTPETTYNDTGVIKINSFSIKNSDLKANGVVDMNTVLEKSLNTGAIFAMREIGAPMFAQYVKDFGFGEKTGIELEGESNGDIRNLISKSGKNELYAATASYGQGLTVTPLQMVTSFAALANGGMLVKPYIVKEIIRNDGSKIITQSKQIKRVISERASMILGGMLVNVVEEGHGQRAGVKGYYVGGKTGTAQVARKDGQGYETNAHIGSFVGYAPVNDPAFVMLVKIDHPRDVEWAESSAAPLFGEIAEFILNYLEIPTERPTD